MKDMKKAIMIAAAAFAVCAHGVVEWRNVDEDAHIAGAVISSPKKLLNRVVLVDIWGKDCPPCRALLPSMQAMWENFGLPAGKPFIVIGSHRQERNDAAIRRIVEKAGVTYPVYQAAKIAEGEPSGDGRLPFMYVLDHRGKVIYRGRDARQAQETVINALAKAGKPPSLTGNAYLVKYRHLEERLEFGKPIADIVKRLKADAAGKNAEAAAEAQRLLASIEQARREVKEEIEFQKQVSPKDAVRLIKQMKVTWPEDALEYKAGFGELVRAARAQVAEERKRDK